MDQAHASFDRMWADLEDVGKDPSGGYRRFAWTREDHTLREWFTAECARRGLDVHLDNVGNQWAWWGDPDQQPGLVIGSHLDSVPGGGAFDGPLGVVSALAVLDALRTQGITPDRPLAVVNFADEEGGRFGVACLGSRILTGIMAPERALALTDDDGTTMADALARAGLDPHRIGADAQALRRIGAYLELHVEQGKALALAPDGSDDPAAAGDPQRAVAIGTQIWPHGRYRLDFTGEANHAGTTRLVDRKDAMLSYADTVLAARRIAARRGCVATMGKVIVTPNGINAVPSQVTGWLDARGADTDQVQAMVEEITAHAAQWGASAREESWTAATDFHPGLIADLQQVLPGAPLLATGAGHDAGILAEHGIPAAMLFVRNPTGISHAPGEYAQPQDCHAGVDAMARAVVALTGERA